VTPHILTLNAGSSSIKFALFDGGADLEERIRGRVEGLGTRPQLQVEVAGNKVDAPLGAAEATDHTSALAAVLRFLGQRFDHVSVAAVGHRVVHGGTDFSESVVLAGLIQLPRKGTRSVGTYARFRELYCR
jgi:acetate kinase